VWWKILFHRIPQFIYESKSERIIEIGPHLLKYRKNKSGTFFMAHGVYIIASSCNFVLDNKLTQFSSVNAV